ncbi:uncharacterized protein LOC142098514 [Mixophyes fleayi]|uniref:uncharacterized protein LOC142098514 n=1 Tax=Mixophyes fleayi TaxID=3061075 RepID=UPI003F4DAACC
MTNHAPPLPFPRSRDSPPPTSSPLLFSLESSGRAGISSNQAPGLLGPAPVSFSNNWGAFSHQVPPVVPPVIRSCGPSVPAGSWPFTPAPCNQPGSASTSTQGFLPYPPKDFRPVLDGGSEWSAPYPSLSGQYLHVYPRPSFYNSAVCSSRDPQLPPPEQLRDRSQRVPPPAGFYGHLTNAPPLVTPAGVPPHISHSLSPPRANVSSHPVTQVQLSSAGTQMDEGGATSLQLRGEESVQATTQQGARQSGSEDEDVTGAVRQEALGTSGSTVTTTRVWVVGHSFIFWAAKHRLADRRFGFKHPVDIRWLGKRGMLWAELIPTLCKEMEEHGTPDIVVIHLGGNDVGRGKSLDLIINIREGLAQIHARWPSIKVCWSNIIPRLSWRSSIPPATLIRVVKKINGYARQNVKSMQRTTAKLDATGHGWLVALAVFDFTLRYRPGKGNIDADAFSRLVGRQAETPEEWVNVPAPEI